MERFDEQILLTDHFDVGQDWEVPIPGFFIVGSRNESKRSIADFSDEEISELGMVLKRVRAAMLSVLGIQDVYLFQNEDTEHRFHVWMFPRYEWMETFGRKIESVRPIMLHAQEKMQSDDDILRVKKAASDVRDALK